VNGWTLAAAVLLGAGLTAALWGGASGPLAHRVTAQNLTTSVACPVLLLLAQGYERASYVGLSQLAVGSVLTPLLIMLSVRRARRRGRTEDGER
jgi:hypothetical protein